MKPAIVPLILLELFLIWSPILDAQVQRAPLPAGNVPTTPKQLLSASGILRLLTPTEADIDGPESPSRQTCLHH